MVLGFIEIYNLTIHESYINIMLIILSLAKAHLIINCNFSGVHAVCKDIRIKKYNQENSIWELLIRVQNFSS
jgi:hypothetical protein